MLPNNYHGSKAKCLLKMKRGIKQDHGQSNHVPGATTIHGLKGRNPFGAACSEWAGIAWFQVYFLLTTLCHYERGSIRCGSAATHLEIWSVPFFFCLAGSYRGNDVSRSQEPGSRTERPEKCAQLPATCSGEAVHLTCLSRINFIICMQGREQSVFGG